MTRTHFTPEEQEQLRANIFTYSVTDTQITFTKEFKESFWEDYVKKHKSPSAIFRDHGYDLKLLGAHRLANCPRHFKEEIDQYHAFHDGPKSQWKQFEEEVPADAADKGTSYNANLEAQVQYLQQEVDFLKKTFSTLMSSTHSK